MVEQVQVRKPPNVQITLFARRVSLWQNEQLRNLQDTWVRQNAITGLLYCIDCLDSETGVALLTANCYVYTRIKAWL